MIQDLLPLYASLIALCCGMAWFAPLLIARMLGGLRRIGAWLAGIAAAFLMLLAGQQLVLVLLPLIGFDGQLPASPLSILLQTLTGALGPNQGRVHMTWWSEELRLISALAMIIAVFGLGFQGQLLRANAFDKGRNLVDLIGGLLLAMPAGLIACWFGWQTAFRAIVSRARTLETIPPREAWVWEGAASFVGFGHVWAFKALVPIAGISMIAVGFVLALSALLQLRELLLGRSK